MTKFVLALSDAEHVRFITRLPCGSSVEVDALKRDLEEHGMLWETDACEPYQRFGPREPGVILTSAH